MNPNDLLLIAKKMGLLYPRLAGNMVMYYVENEGPMEIFDPVNWGFDLLKVMCHFRIWIDDKSDGSEFEAYHFQNGVKTRGVSRKGPATPEGIVEAVLELALEMSK